MMLELSGVSLVVTMHWIVDWTSIKARRFSRSSTSSRSSSGFVAVNIASFSCVVNAKISNRTKEKLLAPNQPQLLDL